MRIEADREVCTGAGNCVTIAPDVCDQEEGVGLVQVLTQQPLGTVQQGRVWRAAFACPSGAMTITE
ncbi:ferredoxin [Catenulispora yoronensis]|uniref:Ferredoxin n=1 Tax=Catenulispora yoronensis TaxID=450799 RepID=A0ABN2U6M7_9ACTN